METQKNDNQPTAQGVKSTLGLDGYIDGVCCGYCTKFETSGCPIKYADPWSKWKNYCSEYEPDKSNKFAMSLVNAIKG